MTAPSAPPRPVALYGALRSGTTLFRLILKHHPALHNPDETDFLLDHIEADPSHPTGWRYDRTALEQDRVFLMHGIALPDRIDGRDLFDAMVAALGAKMPETRLVLVFHRHAGKMAALLPEVPILHLVRDPRDVARSSIGMGWVGNSYAGVDHWIATERSWDAADIAPEAALTVTFEALLGDLEGELKRVCTFLGLDYDPVMLTYHQTSTYDVPAPEIAQKWRQKAGVREVARIEGKCGDLLTARGYAPNTQVVHPSAVEHAWLLADSRIKRWRFNIRRYGAGLFFGHHVARTLGLRNLADGLLARQEAIRSATRK